MVLGDCAWFLRVFFLQEIEKRFNELKKYVWRRIDPSRRMGILRGRGRGFGRRGGYGGRGYGAPSAGFPQAVRH